MVGQDFSKAAKRKLLHITPNAESVIRQLAGQDKVHAAGAETVEQLLRFRIGGDGTNRQAYAMLDIDTWKIASAIFVDKQCQKIITPRDCCDNVQNILSSPVTAMSSVPTAVVFYSICSTAPGAGRELIENLHPYLTQKYPRTIFHTLSPLRDVPGKAELNRFIEEAVQGRNFSTLDEPVQKKIAVDYLKLCIDPVQCFHQTNGARIDDIKLNADSKGLHRLMVIYRYPRDAEELRQNAGLFKEREIEKLISPYLLHEIKDAVLPKATYKSFGLSDSGAGVPVEAVLKPQ